MSAPLNRRQILSAAALGAAAPAVHAGRSFQDAAKDRPTLVGSANARHGMAELWDSFAAGGDLLDTIVGVVKVTEANPNDRSVGIGGIPDEDGEVTLDAAIMHGPTHNSGAVGCLKNILYASEVARLVMERTDHCMLVGEGAYQFARDHGHPHTNLLTESTRKIWMAWRERMSNQDDRLSPTKEDKGGMLFEHDGEMVALEDLIGDKHPTGTIHCSGLSTRGEVACTTTTSGLGYKIPGRVGDSPIIGAGLYCDQEVGSAGATGRGEAAILSNASSTAVHLLRSGMNPKDAGMEVMRRIASQAARAASWQPDLVNEKGQPSFGMHLYLLGLDGTHAGVTIRGGGKYAVADTKGGVRLESLEPLFA